MKIYFYWVFSFYFSALSLAQVGDLTFYITDAQTYLPIDSATVVDLATENTYQSTKIGGEIVLKDLPAGIASFEIQAEGYQSDYLFEKEIKPGINQVIEISLQPIVAQLDEIVAYANARAQSAESPLSVRNLVTEEISRSPGANRDLSIAIQSLPGVTSVSSFRNDLLIRGGGPNENRFFLDKVETPVINHFATQGASGGPRGIINVDFVNEVDFYSSAFPANRGNALSSVFDISYRPASKGKFNFRGIAGLDDASIMADGTFDDSGWSYLVSARRSNLQYLFSFLDLPILPSYYDFQGKIQKKFKNGDKMYLVGISSIDDFELNFDVEETDENLSILDASPQEAPQRSYTLGWVYEKKAKNGSWDFVISRNWIKNESLKYRNNEPLPQNLLFDYSSTESDNRLRIERNWSSDNWKFRVGAGYDQSNYTNNSTTTTVFQEQTFTDTYATDLNFNRYYAFGQLSTNLLQDKLSVSLGARVDANDYNDEMQKILQQFSPRLALSYEINPVWKLNFATGIYYQTPPNTTLGFKEEGELVNQDRLDYIQTTHFALGTSYQARSGIQLSVEGFYKDYNQYPFSLRNGVNLANLGGDFGVIGIEPVSSIGEGRTYGFEFLAQQRLGNKIYGLLSYTLSWSEFSDENGVLIPSSWDARHILNLTAGKRLGKNWQVGARFRMQSALPITPYDLDRSSLVDVWNINQGPVDDFTLLNSDRGAFSHQLDLRVEKKWYLKNWNLGFYVDIVNVYGGDQPADRPFYSLTRDDAGTPIIANPNAPADQQRYILQEGAEDANQPIPFIGFIVEF